MCVWDLQKGALLGSRVQGCRLFGSAMPAALRRACATEPRLTEGPYDRRSNIKIADPRIAVRCASRPAAADS